MKTVNHPHHAAMSRELDEARRLVAGTRRRAHRRRYLYEIEFFDTHVGSLDTRPLDVEPDDLEASELTRPLDPRLREIISAAAQGWVIGQV
ncbi:hypothetical protein DB30_05528 [Enhygromyxa salina]|uniref:Uncharacterized protein n=1 Tax=Enhygromyxa salina TaxID=215803 RepID=A0A0C2D0Y3_9BACT|nr:hypothetical protein [Enhygromyxa salina]KIG15505.1 hypothetical protein DB30_05528 [Enhygromyxa salina]